MRRWDEIVNQESEENHDARVFQAVEAELAEIRRSRRRLFWRRSLYALIPAGATALLAVILSKKSQELPEDVDSELLAFATAEGIEAADLEMLDDLELMEELEDLEAWDEKSEA